MRRLASAALSLAAVLAGPAPATAADVDLGRWRLWLAAPCAAGTMTADALPGRAVRVDGWIEPCQDTPAPGGTRFAIVYFGPTVGVAGRALAYDGPTARTWFEGPLDTKARATPFAVCLASSPTRLLSCVSVDAGDDPDLLAVAPIATDDPRVAVPVLPLLTRDGDTAHHCGTCL